MKSNAYWARRALQRENEAYLRGAALSAKLFREYETAARDIRRQIGDFYARYAGKHGLSYEQAARLLNRREMQEWKADLAAWMERIAREADPLAKARLTAQLDALSTNSRISRLEALLGQVDMILNDLYDRGVAQMKAELGDAFEEGYYKKTYDLQSRAGWLSEAAKLDAATVEKVLAYPWTGAMFSDRLWQNKQALLFHMRETLTQGLIQGKSVAAMSTELSARMGQSYKAAERVVRTETAHFHAEADKEAYRAAGVEEYEFMATLDSRTCESCGPLDGKHFKVADAKTGVNYPPLHPNCVLPTTKVIAPDMEAIIKGEYSGDVVEFGLSDRTRLTVTANHIVLTARGWVRAKNLVKGDKIIRYRGGVKPMVETDPANDDAVPTVEKLFTALVKSSSMPPLSVPVSPKDLKGDAIPNSKVNIVFVNSELRDKLDPSFRKLICDVPLIGTAEERKRHLSVQCTLAEFLMGAGLTADGIMSGLRVADVLFQSPSTHHELVSLRASSNYDTRLIKTALNNLPADVEHPCEFCLARSGGVKGNNPVRINGNSLTPGTDAKTFEQIVNGAFVDPVEISNFLAAFPGIVAFDDITFISSKFYSGHVYDASSQSTLYIANGIVSSNCRCTTVEYDPDEELDWYNAGKPMPENMTWEEWRAQQEDMNGADYVEKERRKSYNQKTDSEQWEKYAKLLGRDAPESASAFQEIKYNDPVTYRLYKLDYSRRTRLIHDPSLTLPGAEGAEAREDKFLKYLFNPDNPRGQAKGAAFTSRLGYEKNNWEELQREILCRARLYPVRYMGDKGFGATYEQKMILYGKTGKPANVIVSWIDEGGHPRMVSAYIKEAKDHED